MSQPEITVDQITPSPAFEGSNITNVDSDTLNGQIGSFYQNADNLNAGTVPTGRLTGTYTINISGNATTCTTASDSNALGGSAAANWAKLANPIFTGNPRAPTAGSSDNDTTISTTAFVKTAISNKIESNDYATSSVGGTVKARVSGTTAYFTINGNNA